jgi:hypothetical protein
VGHYDNDRMTLEVMHQLVLRDEDCIEQLLYLPIAGLSVSQDLADEVYWSLHLECMTVPFLFHHQGETNNLGCCSHVKEECLQSIEG